MIEMSDEQIKMFLDDLAALILTIGLFAIALLAGEGIFQLFVKLHKYLVKKKWLIPGDIPLLSDKSKKGDEKE